MPAGTESRARGHCFGGEAGRWCLGGTGTNWYRTWLSTGVIFLVALEWHSALFSWGKHWCFNDFAPIPGIPAGVLPVLRFFALSWERHRPRIWPILLLQFLLHSFTPPLLHLGVKREFLAPEVWALAAAGGVSAGLAAKNRCPNPTSTPYSGVCGLGIIGFGILLCDARAGCGGRLSCLCASGPPPGPRVTWQQGCSCKKPHTEPGGLVLNWLVPQQQGSKWTPRARSLLYHGFQTAGVAGGCGEELGVLARQSEPSPSALQQENTYKHVLCAKSLSV